MYILRLKPTEENVHGEFLPSCARTPVQQIQNATGLIGNLQIFNKEVQFEVSTETCKGYCKL